LFLSDDKSVKVCPKGDPRGKKLSFIALGQPPFYFKKNGIIR
jgi:hypothetical protein